MIATTLNFDYEGLPAAAAFEDIPGIAIEGEMLDLAEHIIAAKSGRFDPAAFDDRHEAAPAEMVKARIEGRRIPTRNAPAPGKAAGLMAALHESARPGRKTGGAGGKAAPARRTAR